MTWCDVQIRNKARIGELQALGATEVIDVTTENVIACAKAINGALSKAKSRVCPRHGSIALVASTRPSSVTSAHDSR